jgi:pilus assembly protein CpaD
MTHSNSFLRGCAALAGLVLAACAITPNGPEDGLSVEQRFPITVEPHMEMVRLPFDAARGGLDQAGNADLERFARDYLDNGSGALAIDGPRGNTAAARLVADRLVALGVPGDRILLGSPDNFDSGGDVRLTFIRYEAHAEACGDWSTNLGYTSANKVSPNFGCATQHNLAAMVAEPRDLVSPKPLDPNDAQRRLTVLEKYRKGETTVANKAAEQSGSISQVGGGGGGGGGGGK